LIYFVVNNNYQYIEAARLASQLGESGEQCGLIAFPHTLSIPADQQAFATVTVLETPAHDRWLAAWRKYLTINSALKTMVSPGPSDTLVLFTEFELLNQLTAIYFKKNKGRVFLLEDGGVGSYIPLTLKHPQSLTLKERIYTLMVRMIPNLKATHFTKFDGILFPMLHDKYLDAVLLYRSLRINRAVPVAVLARPPLEKISTVGGRVVFLNQPLYCEHIQTPEMYASGLRQILSSLCDGFGEVYFKFHPREAIAAKEKITAEILNDYPAIDIISGNLPFESMLSTIRPEAVCSYNSTPLFNLAGTGIQPIFAYPLLEDLREQSSFRTMHDLLAAWEYNFPTCWKDLSSGYFAGEKFNQTTGDLTIDQVFNCRMGRATNSAGEQTPCRP
jgi:hypothetical protein